MRKKFTPENIRKLKENEFFVFGSNMNGNHAGGAAKIAVKIFGATEGVGEGIQGQSYAIPTLNEDMQKATEADLRGAILRFIDFAIENKNKTFYVTKIGCGIAGFEVPEVAKHFVDSKLAKNVILPKEFWGIIKDMDVTTYKGFNKDFSCRNYKYEIGKEYKDNGAIRCGNKGFHSCRYPLNIFDYYTPDSRFAETYPSGDVDSCKDDTKIASSILKIGAEINIKSLTEAAVKFVFERAKWSNKDRATGYQGAASATGDRGIACGLGIESKAKASLGNWIVLSEWEYNDSERKYERIDVKSTKVDGEFIKTDTWYMLKGGKFVEVE